MDKFQQSNFYRIFFSKKSISHLTEDDDVYRLKLAGISITLYDTLFRSARTSTIVHSIFKFENWFFSVCLFFNFAYNGESSPHMTHTTQLSDH